MTPLGTPAPGFVYRAFFLLEWLLNFYLQLEVERDKFLSFPKEIARS